MSETRRLSACGRGDRYKFIDNICGVRVENENSYPVEVTVRRVAEKVVAEGRVDHLMNDFEHVAEINKKCRAAGYEYGQRVRITIEPLD